MEYDIDIHYHEWSNLCNSSRISWLIEQTIFHCESRFSIRLLFTQLIKCFRNREPCIGDSIHILSLLTSCCMALTNLANKLYCWIIGHYLTNLCFKPFIFNQIMHINAKQPRHDSLNLFDILKRLLCIWFQTCPPELHTDWQMHTLM